MSILGPVPPSQRLHKPDNLSSLLEPGLHQRNINEVGYERVGGNEYVAPWHKNSVDKSCPLGEELAHLVLFLRGKGCEAR
jgi:hypothetical protein